ncbi:MAG: FixH family protein [Planctomycetota bacterium]
MRPHIFWPAFIVSIFMVSVVFMGILLSLATGDPNLEVEPDYYARAMSWDERQALRASSARLGWRTDITHEGDVLRVTVHDADDVLVGDTIRVMAFHRALRSEAHTLEQTADEPGVFTLPLSPPKAGLWNVALEVTSGDVLYIEDVRLRIDKDG